MLVRNGHGIVLKTLMGRIPAAVTHMSFGSSYGSGINVSSDFYRENMGFEILRIPVQVGYDHLTSIAGQSVVGKDEFQLVYKGEIPTNRRIAFNEIGLWCGSSNIRYGDAGGTLISTVESAENWLLKQYVPGQDGELVQYGQSIVQEDQFFRAVQHDYYDNVGIKPSQPRIGNTALAIPAWYQSNAPTIDKYELATNVDLSQYSPLDTIKFAVSWAPAMTGLSTFTSPMSMRWTIHCDFNFTASDPNFESGSMEFDYNLDWDFSVGNMNTYTILEKELGDLTSANRGILKSIDIGIIGWGQNGTVVPPVTSYVLIDGIRIDRTTNNNPLYGLIFYDYVYKSSIQGGVTFKTPIEKLAGFDGHLEHRVRLLANATGEQSV